MERSLQKIIYFLLILIFSHSVYSQLPSQDEQIRLQVWADLDAFPGQFEDEALSETDKTGINPDVINQVALTIKDLVTCIN